MEEKKIIELGINSFSFDPGTIAKGGKTTLHWETVGSKSCAINPGNMNVALSGQMDIYSEDCAKYTLRQVMMKKSCTESAEIFIGMNPIINTASHYQQHVTPVSGVGFTIPTKYHG